MTQACTKLSAGMFMYAAVAAAAVTPAHADNNGHNAPDCGCNNGQTTQPVTPPSTNVNGGSAPTTGGSAPVTGGSAPVTGGSAPVTGGNAPTTGGTATTNSGNNSSSASLKNDGNSSSTSGVKDSGNSSNTNNVTAQGGNQRQTQTATGGTATNGNNEYSSKVTIDPNATNVAEIHAGASLASVNSDVCTQTRVEDHGGISGTVYLVGGSYKKKTVSTMDPVQWCVKLKADAGVKQTKTEAFEKVSITGIQTLPCKSGTEIAMKSLDTLNPNDNAPDLFSADDMEQGKAACGQPASTIVGAVSAAGTAALGHHIIAHHRHKESNPKAAGAAAASDCDKYTLTVDQKGSCHLVGPNGSVLLPVKPQGSGNQTATAPRPQ